MLFPTILIGGILFFFFDIALGLGASVSITVILLLASFLGIIRLLAIGSEWINRIVLVTLVFFACTTSAEILFRAFAVRDVLPKTEQDFNRSIASTWPRAIPVERKPDTLRILGLSDSFGKAGKHANFHYLLEHMLHKKEYSNVEVINLSMTGLALMDELLLFQRMGSRYEPDVVLHSIFVGNDLHHSPGKLIECAGIRFRVYEGLSGFRPRNLIIVTWIRSWIILQMEILREKAEQRRGEYLGALSRIGFLNSLEKEKEVYLTEPSSIRWDENFEVLDAIRGEVTRSGAAYLSVIHPSPIQFDETVWSDVVSHFDLDPKDYDLKLPQARLQSYFASRNVPSLDLLPIFEDHEFKARLYQKHDIHYKTLGNRVAAEAILEFLRRENIVDDE